MHLGGGLGAVRSGYVYLRAYVHVYASSDRWGGRRLDSVPVPAGGDAKSVEVQYNVELL